MEITQDQLDDVVSKSITKFLAELKTSTRTRPDSEKRIRIDLSADRSIALQEYGVPMRAIQVVNQSDPAVKFEIVAESREDHKVKNAVPLGVNDGFDYGRQISRWYLKNDPQAGKWVEILLSVDGSFKSGKQLSLNAGGVAINEGASILTRDRTGLNFGAASRAIITAADSLRNSETIVNLTGQMLWLGDGGVTDDTGNFPGIPFAPNDTFVWKNTSALYAYNPGAALTNAKISRNREA